MDKLPRFVPIWLWVTVIIIVVILCSSCRGGKSLGRGSAGTIITPRTPQEINKENAPIPSRLPPPTPIAPTKTTSERSSPVAPKSESAKANPIIIDPKPARGQKSFTPTINRNAPPVKLPPVKLPPVKLPPVKLPKEEMEATNDELVIITPSTKNLPTDNKATSPEIAGPREPTPSEGEFGWIELILNYFLFIILAIFIWTIYDILKIRRGTPDKIRKQNGVKKTTKKAAKRKPAKKKAAKKKTSPKELKEYKKTIPKGQFLKSNEKPKQ